MGSEQSEFEEQFHQLYRFIGVQPDKAFQAAKIYRRTKFNFDYIMLVQRPLSQFAAAAHRQPPAQQVAHRLQLIRKYQNSFTVNLSYSHIVDSAKLQCQAPTVRLYIEYYSHTLHDYLSALRANKLQFSFEELVFVANSLVQATLALKKMEIQEFLLSLDNILVSADQGKVVLNPVVLYYQSAVVGCNGHQVKQLSGEYQPIDLATSTSRAFNTKQSTPENLLINNIRNVFMEMARYLKPEELLMAHRLFAVLGRCQAVAEMLVYLPLRCEELRLEQFGEVQEPLRLYSKPL